MVRCNALVGNEHMTFLSWPCNVACVYKMIRMKACVSYESFLYSWIPTVTNAHLSLFDSKQKAPNLLVFYNSRARDTLGEENEGEVKE